MKRILSFLLVTSIFLMCASADTIELEKRFIKGSIAEKIEVVHESTGDDALFLAIKGLDYAIENAPTLGSDQELCSLAVASILAIPKIDTKLEAKPFNQSELSTIREKLLTVFSLFTDETVRISVLDRLPGYASKDDDKTVTLLNDFLSRAFNANEAYTAVIGTAIDTLPLVGNTASLKIIYNIWYAKKWEECSESTERALAVLSEAATQTTMELFSALSLEDSIAYFSVLKNSSEISSIFLCEVAENVLFLTINKAENLQDSDAAYKSAFVSLQLATLSVISEHKWSHASQVVNVAVTLSKREYDALILSEEQFITVITESVLLPTSELAQILSEFLADCNSLVEKGDQPAKQVVLALISALETLGDKSAFDNLLYVTYLTAYPDEVILAARLALASLKW